MKLNLSLKETRDKAVSALHRRGFLHRISGEFRVNFGQISFRLSEMASSWFGIKPLRDFFPASTGHHQDEDNRHPADAEAVYLLLLRLRKRVFDSKTKQKNRTIFGCAIWFVRDSVGIRTQDPQLRRLLLYPAELPNRPSFLAGCSCRTEMDCKYTNYSFIAKNSIAFCFWQTSYLRHYEGFLPPGTPTDPAIPPGPSIRSRWNQSAYTWHANH